MSHGFKVERVYAARVITFVGNYFPFWYFSTVKYLKRQSMGLYELIVDRQPPVAFFIFEADPVYTAGLTVFFRLGK